MKITKHALYNRCIATVLSGVLLITGSCKKEPTDDGLADANSINSIVADNFNLSILNAALKHSRQDLMLKGKGPFTLLAPSDAAFSEIYINPNEVAKADKNDVARTLQYHILDGRYNLSKLPFQFNQELRSQGGKLYLTRWIKGTDTVITINGARVLAKSITASNGVIQVINRVLTPYIHDRLGDALSAEPTVTLFYQAIVSSGMLDIINSSGPFTIMAPTNAAMQAAGYATVAQVSDTDPDTLKKLVSYHIIRDRRFIYDYILGTTNATTTRQNMYDGNPITINLVVDNSQPGGFGGITLQGAGNTSGNLVVKQDVLTGNGVLHIIDGVLVPAP